MKLTQAGGVAATRVATERAGAISGPLGSAGLRGNHLMRGFSDAVAIVLSDRIEGGYSNNPRDPGGETNHGITWPILRQAITLNLVAGSTTIRTLSKDDAERIYKRLFWDAMHGSELPYSVALVLFDTAINHGVTWATGAVQRALGLKQDHVFGPQTLGAARASDRVKLITAVVHERLKHYLKEVPAETEETFELGWVNRIVDILVPAIESAVEEGRAV